MTDSGVGDSRDVTVGQVLGPRGTRGHIRVKVLSDVPHRFQPGQVIYIRDHPYPIVDSTSPRPNQVILQLDGLDSLPTARRLVGEWITTPQGTSPQLPDGEYFHFQLLGLEVRSDAGEELGQVKEIIETGSNDVYVVSNGNSDILIPAVGQVIQKIDLTEGVIVVKLIEGLR